MAVRSFVFLLLAGSAVFPAPGARALAAGSAPPAHPAAPASLADLLAWGTVPSPNGGYDVNNRLQGVSVLSGADVWAVGAYGDGILHLYAQIQHWDGRRWAALPLPDAFPDGELRGVQAIAPDDVWFVGGAFNSSGQSFILHWDGARLRPVPHPDPSASYNKFYAVTALAPDDVWAAGEYAQGFGVTRTLIEHWDGSAWTVVPSPSEPGTYNPLYGITAVAANNVWAVGAAGFSTLALHWDGAAWQRVPTPNQGRSAEFHAISAVSSAEVWAVGKSRTGAISARWDGTTWAPVPVPTPNGNLADLNGVAAVDSTTVWAVGTAYSLVEDLTLALRWDGSRWTPVRSPSPDRAVNRLYAVDAAAGEVWAVGQGGGTLVERWTGARWRVVPSANSGTTDNILNDVATLATGDVWAVGQVFPYDPDSLAMHWDGTRWTITPTPNEREGTALEGVAALSADDVWAVGTSYDTSGLDSSTAALRWDGAHWKLIDTPDPGGEQADTLLDVAAVSATDIWAVGGAGYPTRALVLHWDGFAWTEVPNACGTVELYGVGVVSASDIWAVGTNTTCHYDGGTWAQVPSPQPREPVLAYPLEDVAGAQPADVWAVGSYKVRSGMGVETYSFAEHWDGSRWTEVFGLLGATLYDLDVRASNDIWVSGTSGIGTLILHYDGQTWEAVPTPNQYASGSLNAIAALPTGQMWAVGYDYDAGQPGVERTLIVDAPSATQGTVVGAVNISGITISWFGPVTGTTTGSSDTGYSVAGLPAGTYLFTATYFGCTPASARVEVVAGRTVTQDFTLECS